MRNKTNNIFTDPPDGLGDENFCFGAFIASVGIMDGIEIARAFADAADRLLAAAAEQRESWEAVSPILFCYRHALELYLKALSPKTKHSHNLGKLAQSLKPYLDGRYPADQVAWLIGSIAEFDRVDPKSTVFRYHDGLATSYKAGEQPDPELWVDYNRLRRATAKIFQGLEQVRLSQFNSHYRAEK